MPPSNDNASDPVSVVLAWQEAASSGEIETLLALSAPGVSITGPRGTTEGHVVLKEWGMRSGISFEPLRTFSRGDTVIVEQHAVWREGDSEEIIGESDIVTLFAVRDGKVAELVRYDSLDQALSDAGLTEQDIV